jgi:DNA topoisomerase-1
MLIYRKREKDKWYYVDSKNNVIKDKKILEYIKNLVIPPAYENVEINYINNPKVLFVGYDNKGRRQQIYSKKWRDKADKKKFKLLIEFGKKIPLINININKNIDNNKNNKEKLISIILRLTNLCGFRIGQLKYQKLYNSIGLSTLQKKHLNFINKGLKIKFIGKKGVVNDCLISNESTINKKLIKSLKELYDNTKKPSDYLFIYEENNIRKVINSYDVNDWLKEFNPEFTTKIFRTFDVNIKLIEELLKHTKASSLTKKERKKIIVSLIKEISCSINNTPAICKKSYLNPELINLYLEHPIKFNKLMNNNLNPTYNFINFLEKKL